MANMGESVITAPTVPFVMDRDRTGGGSGDGSMWGFLLASLFLRDGRFNNGDCATNNNGILTTLISDKLNTLQEGQCSATQNILGAVANSTQGLQNAMATNTLLTQGAICNVDKDIFLEGQQVKNTVVQTASNVKDTVVATTTNISREICDLKYDNSVQLNGVNSKIDQVQFNLSTQLANGFCNVEKLFLTTENQRLRDTIECNKWAVLNANLANLNANVINNQNGIAGVSQKVTQIGAGNVATPLNTPTVVN